MHITVLQVEKSILVIDTAVQMRVSKYEIAWNDTSGHLELYDSRTLRQMAREVTDNAIKEEVIQRYELWRREGGNDRISTVLSGLANQVSRPYGFLATPINDGTLRVHSLTAINTIGALLRYSDTLPEGHEREKLVRIAEAALSALSAMESSQDGPDAEWIRTLHNVDVSQSYGECQNYLPDLIREIRRGVDPRTLENYEIIRAAEAIARYLELDLGDVGDVGDCKDWRS